MHPADEQLPDLRTFDVGPEREAYYDATSAESRGDAAASSHDSGTAAAEYAKAADGYLTFVRSFDSAAPWALTLRYHAAELYFRAGAAERAAALAQQVAGQAAADARSRAVAGLLYANAKVKAGELPPLRMVGTAERKGAPPRQRPLAAPWQQFVDATTAYLATAAGGRRAPARPSGLTPAQLALVAAEVEFATDDMSSARRFLEVILERWPEEAAVFAKAAPMYLEMFLVTADDPAYEEGLARIADEAERQARRAGPDADTYTKILDEVQRNQARLRYRSARRLLDEGKPVEAARLYEALAAAPASDPAVALGDAAFAWDRAGDAARARAARERIVKEHPDSPAATDAMLALAAVHAKAGEHAEAAHLYASVAARATDDPRGCVALRNGAIEFDRANDAKAAASAYIAFGRSAKCAKTNPDVAATALYRAATLYRQAKRPREAQDAYRAVVALDGVAGPEAKRLIREARRKLRRP